MGLTAGTVDFVFRGDFAQLNQGLVATDAAIQGLAAKITAANAQYASGALSLDAYRTTLAKLNLEMSHLAVGGGLTGASAAWLGRTRNDLGAYLASASKAGPALAPFAANLDAGASASTALAGGLETAAAAAAAATASTAALEAATAGASAAQAGLTGQTEKAAASTFTLSASRRAELAALDAQMERELAAHEAMAAATGAVSAGTAAGAEMASAAKATAGFGDASLRAERAVSRFGMGAAMMASGTRAGVFEVRSMTYALFQLVPGIGQVVLLLSLAGAAWMAYADRAAKAAKQADAAWKKQLADLHLGAGGAALPQEDVARALAMQAAAQSELQDALRRRAAAQHDLTVAEAAGQQGSAQLASATARLAAADRDARDATQHLYDINSRLADQQEKGAAKLEALTEKIAKQGMTARQAAQYEAALMMATGEMDQAQAAAYVHETLLAQANDRAGAAARATASYLKEQTEALEGQIIKLTQGAAAWQRWEDARHGVRGHAEDRLSMLRANVAIDQAIADLAHRQLPGADQAVHDLMGRTPSPYVDRTYRLRVAAGLEGGADPLRGSATRLGQDFGTILRHQGESAGRSLIEGLIAGSNDMGRVLQSALSHLVSEYVMGQIDRALQAPAAVAAVTGTPGGVPSLLLAGAPSLTLPGLAPSAARFGAPATPAPAIRFSPLAPLPDLARAPQLGALHFADHGPARGPVVHLHHTWHVQAWDAPSVIDMLRAHKGTLQQIQLESLDESQAYALAHQLVP